MYEEREKFLPLSIRFWYKLHIFLLCGFCETFPTACGILIENSFFGGKSKRFKLTLALSSLKLYAYKFIFTSSLFSPLPLSTAALSLRVFLVINFWSSERTCLLPSRKCNAGKVSNLFLWINKISSSACKFTK